MEAASIRTLIASAHGVIDFIVFLLGWIAILVFMFGLAKFIYKADDDKGQEEGKNLMVWGLVSLFVMFSVWGIIYLAQRDIGIEPTVTPETRPERVPTLPPDSIDINTHVPGSL